MLRAPNHDVAVVTMVRAELSSHRVGIHKVSRMARAGCLFEGVMVTNVGCSSIGPGAEVAPSGLQGCVEPLRTLTVLHRRHGWTSPK